MIISIEKIGKLMRAVVRNSHKENAVTVEDIELPDYSQNEIRIRINAAGVCGSDVGACLTKPEYDYMSTPAVLGHECAGIVDAIGGQVEHIETGDRVVLQPGNPCGVCFQCTTAEENNCPNREPAVAEGGFATYTVTDADHVVPVPDTVPMVRAAITEPLAVTHRAVITKGDVSPGDTVLVQGPGPMGAFSALIARLAGAEVIVVGLPSDSTRLEILSDIGIETVISPVAEEETTMTFIEEYTSRGGFDVTIDATGAAAGIESGVSVTRNGGNLIVLGIVSDTIDIDLAKLVRSEIDLRTAHGTTTEDFIRALALLDTPDALPVEQLIDMQYSPNNPLEAFNAFIEAETIKPVFDLDDFTETQS